MLPQQWGIVVLAYVALVAIVLIALGIGVWLSGP